MIYKHIDLVNQQSWFDLSIRSHRVGRLVFLKRNAARKREYLLMHILWTGFLLVMMSIVAVHHLLVASG